MSAQPLGRLRIISGAKKGRRLLVPRGGEVRPTSQMVREAVFDILGPVGGLRVLDLFAGTGALGLEALSRGAESCVFVEYDPAVATILRRNIVTLDYDALSQVVATDYRNALRHCGRGGSGFDLLFVDPPYRMLPEVEVTLAPLVPSLLAPRGVMVIEGPKSSGVAFGQVPIFERDYGETSITVIRCRRDDP